MQILDPIEAISPALARTRLFLYNPFRKGRTWKLSATAYLSFAGTVFLPFTLVYGAAAFAVPGVPHFFKLVMVGVSLLLTALYVVTFILCGQLKFAFFDMVLNREEFVAPTWRKYGPQSRRWTGVKMLAGTVFTALLTAPVYPLVRHVIGDLQSLPTVTPYDPRQGMPPQLVHFMMAFYGTYFVAMIVVGLYFLVLSTVSSFVVPTMALENATVAESLRRFGTFARREPGQLLGFVGMRFVLALAGYVAVTLAYEIVLFVLLAVLACIFGLLGLLLHVAGVPSTVLFGLGAVLFVVFMFTANIYLLCLALGPFFTFFEAHTLYFLGGRYPLLGELLERSTPPQVLYVPPPGYEQAYPAVPLPPR